MRRKGMPTKNMAQELEASEEHCSQLTHRELRLRASGLVRMLIYASAEAKELGSEISAAAIVDALNRVKTEFDLRDVDILPSGPPSVN